MAVKLKTIRKDQPKELTKSTVKSLSLDEIEQMMVQLATANTDDVVVAITNEKKMALLEKVANLKMRRLELRELEKSNVVKESKPIQLEIVNNSENNDTRIDRIDKEIENNYGMREDA